MPNFSLFFKNNKIVFFSILAIFVYLILKSLFWPMQKNITVLIQQQQGRIFNLDTSKDIIKQQTLIFDTINFRQDKTLFHNNTGNLDFENDFFMNLSTTIRVLKKSNYLFRIKSDDGFRLLIDNAVVCEHIEGREFSTSECFYPLDIEEYSLNLEYYQGYGGMGLQLSYQEVNGYENSEFLVGIDSNKVTFHLSKIISKPSQAAVVIDINDINNRIDQAKSGDSVAQFSLAKRYLNGDGVKKNNKEAFKWLNLAAKNGETDAQLTIGKMYFYGKGIKQDKEKAWYWLKLSANNFNGDAEYFIGKLYYDGEDVEQDYIKAFYWIKLAAIGEGEDLQHPFFVSKTSGDADAKLLLGKMYQLGQGVGTSEVLAKKWILSAEKSN
jgi:TPR repeat protein